MYFLSILTLILVSIFMAFFTDEGFGTLINYIDIVSLFSLLIIVIPILVSSNLLKDFNNAFKLVIFKKKAEDMSEIKRAIETIELTMKVLIYAGVFILLFFAVVTFKFDADKIMMIGPNMSFAVLSLFYAVMINLILQLLKSKLKIMLIEFMKE